MKQATFHRLALVTAACTFVQLLMGGIVHGTGSSLACPDWPLCYGEVFPEMVGGVLYEHSHRLLGTLVGILSIALLVGAWREPARRPLALGVLGVVIVQGVLGGLTVIFKLPTLVSTAHLGVSMVFFALVALLGWRSRPRASAPAPLPAGLRRLLVVTTGVVYAQIVLGALVRHTGAGVACMTEIPTCLGSWWPSVARAQAQMLHRYVGVGAALLVLAAAFPVFRAVAGHRVARLAAALAPLLVATQVLLGILSVTSLLGLWQVTAHLGVGALLLVDLWVLCLATRAPAQTAERAVALQEAAA